MKIQMEVNEELMFWNTGEVAGLVPISQCSSLCPLGYRKQLIKVDEVCCWACGKCEDYEYLPNETACVDCGTGFWPTEDRTRCFDLSINHLKHMRWNTWHSSKDGVRMDVGVYKCLLCWSSVIPAVIATIGTLMTGAVIVIYIL